MAGSVSSSKEKLDLLALPGLKSRERKVSDAADLTDMFKKPDRGSHIPDIPPEMLTYKTVSGSDGTYARRPSVKRLLYGASPSIANFDENEETAALNQEDIEDNQEALSKVQWDSKSRQFGLWDGVFARCLLNIFGVIMFLRLGYVVAIAGVGWSLVIIVLSSTVTTMTAMSLSAITTNGEVLGGGAYLMISRSLGPQFGGAIGILFTLANAISVSMYIVGFAETMVESAGSLGFEGLWDIRIYGLITLVIIAAICIGGIGWVIKIQLGLLVALVFCIISVIAGAFMVETNVETGIVAASWDQLSENWGPAWDLEADKPPFFYPLGIFFPAATGIMAGANISGELRDPHRAISVGTLLAIGVSTVIYLILACVIGMSTTRDALFNNYLIMKELSFWGPSILAGIYAATLSSAIAAYVGAPRILKAVADDDLFPILGTFKKMWRDEPIRGYMLCFTIGVICVLIGDLNAIAPLISGFFMISYAFINLACFAASYANTPGWRPTFKYYNKWVALVTAVVCMILLFLLDVVFGALTCICGVGLYKYLDMRDLDISWGSAVEASRYKSALRNILRLDATQRHIKNYRPQLLVLSGPVSERLELVKFSQSLRKSKGVMIYGNVMTCPSIDNLGSLAMRAAHHTLLKARATPALPALVADAENGLAGFKNGFEESILAPDLRTGVRSLLQTAGLSKIRPNVLMMGFQNWMTKEKREVEGYVDIIREAFFYGYGVVLVRDWEHINVPATPSEHDQTLDVWWLYDDGGLTILLPYLLQQKWKHAKIRIFVLSINSNMDSSVPQMAVLIHKFRIDAEVIPVELEVKDQGNVGELQTETIDRYQSLWHASEKGDEEVSGGDEGESKTASPENAATTTEVTIKIGKQPKKSKKPTPSKRAMRHLKISELIKEKSSNAALILLTMPIPEVTLDACEYMRWLECLASSAGPPVCLLRGNQETVLTFEL